MIVNVNKATVEWFALTDAVDQLVRQGRPPVCRSAPDMWFADLVKIRREAAQACTWCPVIALCGAYAEAAGEQNGVWGGIDRTNQPAHEKEIA